MISLTQLSSPVIDTDLHEQSQPFENGPLIDGCGRQIDHLRLSVTTACDLRCTYCRPGSNVGCGTTSRALSDAQRRDLVQYLYEHCGLRQLRLTGGEPLLHRTFLPFLDSVRSAAPELAIAMTTNGQRLARCAGELRRAGLERLNISLDTLDAERYRDVTGGELSPVLRGIDAVMAAGFPPPRINVVVLRDVNDGELNAIAAWGLGRKLEIRFLEAMPIGPAAADNQRRFVSGHEIRQILERQFSLSPIERGKGETAARYRATSPDVRGLVGIIAPLSEAFCGQCRRMRVTAEGRLYPCLLDDRSVDLRPCWKGVTFLPGTARAMIQRAIGEKRPTGQSRQSAAMIALGG